MNKNWKEANEGLLAKAKHIAEDLVKERKEHQVLKIKYATLCEKYGNAMVLKLRQVLQERLNLSKNPPFWIPLSIRLSSTLAKDPQVTASTPTEAEPINEPYIVDSTIHQALNNVSREIDQI